MEGWAVGGVEDFVRRGFAFLLFLWWWWFRFLGQWKVERTLGFREGFCLTVLDSQRELHFMEDCEAMMTLCSYLAEISSASWSLTVLTTLVVTSLPPAPISALHPLPFLVHKTILAANLRQVVRDGSI